MVVLGLLSHKGCVIIVDNQDQERNAIRDFFLWNKGKEVINTWTITIPSDWGKLLMVDVSHFQGKGSVSLYLDSYLYTSIDPS